MDKPASVYFFGTCLIDMILPQAGLAAMRLLQREGIKVVYPQGQTCCGQPAYNSGYDKEARAVGRRQLDAFPRDIPVVVPSASCAGMIKVQYPRLFAGTPDKGRADHLAARVYELTDFLARVLDWRRRRPFTPGAALGKVRSPRRSAPRWLNHEVVHVRYRRYRR